MQSLGSIACKWDILFVVKCLEKTEKSEEEEKNPWLGMAMCC
jgi:hypothetical protein